jgi:hypothetical protein
VKETFNKFIIRVINIEVVLSVSDCYLLIKQIFQNSNINKNHLPDISDKWFISKLSCQGSNLDSSDSESDVLPITLQDNNFLAKI